MHLWFMKQDKALFLSFILWEDELVQRYKLKIHVISLLF